MACLKRVPVVESSGTSLEHDSASPHASAQGTQRQHEAGRQSRFYSSLMCPQTKLYSPQAFVYYCSSLPDSRGRHVTCCVLRRAPGPPPACSASATCSGLEPSLSLLPLSPSTSLMSSSSSFCPRPRSSSSNSAVHRTSRSFEDLHYVVAS